MRRLERDLDNLRSAIAVALAGGVDPVMAVKIEVALMRFRWLRGFSTEGRNNIRASLVLPALQGPTVARAFALYTGGALAMNQSDYGEARTMLTEALTIRRGLGQRTEVAGVSSTLATLHVQMGDIAKAREYQEESLAIFRELANELGEAIGLRNLGEISIRQGDGGEARRLFEQCLILAHRMKHEELQSDCERSLGELELGAGNLDAARKRFDRSLTLCCAAHDKRGEAITRWRLGVTDEARGELESARVGLTDAIQALQSFGMNAELIDCLEDYAELLQRTGQTENAVQLLAAAGAARARLNLARTFPMERDSQATLEPMRIVLGEPRYQSAWSTGRRLSLEDATRLAVAVGRAKALAA
jgi:tetratricopeptide (TPR) repeat protein